MTMFYKNKIKIFINVNKNIFTIGINKTKSSWYNNYFKID